MRIRQNERFCPFSHTPGVKCPLPGTQFVFQIYPNLIRVFDTTHVVEEISLGLKGPIDGFTVQLDLERGHIKVWGTSSSGYYRYRILREKEEWKVEVEKSLVPSLFSESIVAHNSQPQKLAGERLFLGCQKAQQWERIRRDAQATEVLPFLFQLGQWYQREEAAGGTMELLEQLTTVDKVQWADSFRNFFLASFDGILAPRTSDADHLGFDLNQNYSGSPLALIHHATVEIRSLFFKQVGEGWALLPRVPPQFHCGKLKAWQMGSHFIDMEWTKKSLRRMIIQSGRDEEVSLLFPKEMKRFRLRSAFQEIRLKKDVPLRLNRGETYYLDRFEA